MSYGQSATDHPILLTHEIPVKVVPPQLGARYQPLNPSSVSCVRVFYVCTSWWILIGKNVDDMPTPIPSKNETLCRASQGLVAMAHSLCKFNRNAPIEYWDAASVDSVSVFSKFVVKKWYESFIYILAVFSSDMVLWRNECIRAFFQWSPNRGPVLVKLSWSLSSNPSQLCDLS